ncbi:DEAD/DEAH box helicase [Peribacillus frigoritolerans]|uniref:DEAD/DEAH box helicase n=1 Tax=Peribacillus frigoritolerans TaxID=450367 RepID=UPI00399F4136
MFVNIEDIAQINILLKELKEKNGLTTKEYKVLLEKSYHLFSEDNDDLYNLGLSVICHIAERKPTDPFIQQLLYDCMVSSRVFLYADMYDKLDNNFIGNIDMSYMDMISKEFYTLNTNTVLTKDQKKLFDDFQEYRRLIVSAPTSFGKSRIISEIIAHNNYKNIAIILPTIALLNETYQKFKETAFLSEYNLINSIAQPISENKNIFILTPEKMDMILDQDPRLKIDFFTMDEIYKIQDDNDRRTIFTHCLYRLTKKSADFYLIGPYFNGFSENFLKETNAVFRKYKAEIVQKDIVDLSIVDYQGKYKIENITYKKLRDKDRNLFNVLKSLKGQSLIYLGQRGRVEGKAKKIAQTKEKKYHNDLIDYIKENIHNNWSLAELLEKGIAFHHSSIPKYIQTEIVEAFNNEQLDILICTTTLTEGVNTSAKNVIIYDNFKGKQDLLLNGFDVKNIKGRAGRFLSHFLGRVIILENLSEEKDKGTIEFSYYDNDNLDTEETIQVDKVDLLGRNLVSRNEVEYQLEQINIPFHLIQSNKFIPVFNQIKLIRYFRDNLNVLSEMIFNGNMPNKSQFSKILQICHQFLFNDRDANDRTMFLGNLIRLTNFYIYRSPLIKDLINNQNGQHIDTKVRNTFYLISHYFEFALPRYLTIFEKLFNFVYEEKTNRKEGINLKPLITKLEFGYINKHQIALREAGIPVNIINKISEKFTNCENIDDIKLKISLNPQLLNMLSSFEMNLLKKYI